MTLLSVSGLYQYDDTIFDNLHISEELDKPTLVAWILTECAELEILLPDPDVFKESVNYWSLAQMPIWQKLYESTQFDYNPIWNKDGTYTETRNLANSDTETRNLATSDTETRNLAKTNLETRNLASSADTTGTGKVSAYNSSSFENASQDVVIGSGTDTGTVDNTGSDTGTVTRGGSDTGTVTRGGTDTGTVTRRETGNIGVTTTQQMIREEREVSQFSIYWYIVESFKSMYCLGVY